MIRIDTCGVWEVEDPAWLDQVGVGERAAIRLGLAAVLLVDLGPAVRVIEVFVGEVPERVPSLDDDGGDIRRLSRQDRRGRIWLRGTAAGNGENPAGVEVLRVRADGRAVRLRSADVEVTDLTPTHPVAEEPIGNVPERVAALHLVERRRDARRDRVRSGIY